jgi:hypothetical protein
LLENVFFGEKGVCVRTPLQRGLDSSEYDLLRSEEFVQVNTVNDFPPAVKEGLHWLTNDDCPMANSNEAIQETDGGEPGKKLPIRQLTKAGASEHFFLLSYRRGGYSPSDSLLLFERDGEKVFLTRGLHKAKVCSFADAVKLITDTTHHEIDTYWQLTTCERSVSRPSNKTYNVSFKVCCSLILELSLSATITLLERYV